MRDGFLPYNPRLIKLARQLRKEMTLAEVLLWQRLRNQQMGGYDFVRQRPIDEYIVDFFCKDLMLAVESDGRSHDVKGVEDLIRQKRLESLGIRFVRFTEQEVVADLQSVLDAIENWIRINALEGNGRHPPLTPPEEGKRKD